MSAAYMLGALAGGDDREALNCLQALVTAEEECVRVSVEQAQLVQ